MSKKIYISPSSQEGNLYATGGTNEKVQCKKIASACFDFLKAKGFDVKCTYSDNMYDRVSESNDFDADIHLAIHTNATANHNVTGGTQILLYSLTGERKKIGQAVLNRLAPATPGSSAERLIENPSFYEINSANGITVYCECEFQDTKQGSDFIIKNTKLIGELIAKGICDYYDVDTAEKIEPVPNKKVLYTVQVGAFRSKNNAEKYVEELKKDGYDAIIIEK